MSLRIRRGLSTDLPTPVEGELLYTTDNGNLFVGFYDQAQDAVIPKLTSGQLIDDPNPTLAADLDLAGNSIIGVGNIQIDGTVFASGNINLGDNSDDQINFTGQINTALIASSDGAYDLGTQNVRWRTGYFEGLNVDGNINTSSVTLDQLYSPNSSVIYNANTDSIQVSSIFAETLYGANVVDTDSSVVINVQDRTFSGSEVIIDDDHSIVYDANIRGLNFKNTSFDWDTEVKWNISKFEGIVIAETPYRTQTVEPEIASSLLVTNTFRGNYENKTSLQLGDQVGTIAAQGFVGDPGLEQEIFLGLIQTRIDDSTTVDNDFPCSMSFAVSGYDGTEQIASLSSRGAFNAPIIQSGVYADDTERDSQVGTPEKGMIVFNDTTGTFQGYNGTSWVDLS